MGVIADLFVKLSLNKKGFDQGLNEAKQKTSMFGQSMKQLGGMIAGVFAVSSIVGFVRESQKLAAETENVRKAFIRMGGGSYFKDLNEATRGTLSQVELMKNTIQASNFGIPIKDLANLFKFATERAAQTGQSVEYLTQSIVMGIGRKSVLILDNLGISAVQLREKLKKVGEEAATVGDVAEAIGSIAQEQFKRMGEQASTTAQKLDDVRGSWQDIKVAIGDAINQNDLFVGGVKLLGDYLNVFSKQAENAMTNAGSRVKTFMSGLTPDMDISDQKTAIKAEIEKINKAIEEEQKKLSPFAWLTIQGKRNQDDAKQEINTLKNQAIELSGIFDTIKTKVDPVPLMQRIDDLELLIEMEKKLASQKGISSEDALTHAKAIKKAEEELKELREIAGIAERKTATEQLADLKKVNDELEAQKILRMDMYGESMISMTPKGTPQTIDSAPGDAMGLDTAFLDNMDNHYKLIAEKRAKFTKEEKQAWVDFTIDLDNTISQGVGNAIESFASGIGELIAGDMDIKDFGSQLLSVVGKFMQTLGGLFIAMGVAKLKFDISLMSGNAFGMIAAGAMMVAAGAAISSFASKGVSGGASTATAASGYSSYSGSSQSSMALTGDVTFELRGDKLQGVLNNTNRKNNLIR